MGPVAQGEALGYLLPLQERFSGITSHLELQMCDGTDPSPFIWPPTSHLTYRCGVSYDLLWVLYVIHPAAAPFTVLLMMTLEIISLMPNTDYECRIYRIQSWVCVTAAVWMFTSRLLSHIMERPFSSNDGSLRTLRSWRPAFIWLMILCVHFSIFRFCICMYLY